MSLVLLLILEILFSPFSYFKPNEKEGQLLTEHRELEKNIEIWEEKVFVAFQIFFVMSFWLLPPVVVHPIDLLHVIPEMVP